jgi:hypothetical protein
MKAFTLFVLLLGATVANGQSDTLNKRNAAGKQDGTWTLYLDKNWNEVSDSAKADFYRYTFYDNGRNVYPMELNGKNWKMTRTGENDKQGGRIKLLDGQYTWTDSKGQNRAVCVFKNGNCTLFKWFDPSTGMMKWAWDYTKQWRNEPHTCCYMEYEKDGTIKYYYMRKGDNGWAVYPGSKDGI